MFPSAKIQGNKVSESAEKCKETMFLNVSENTKIEGVLSVTNCKEAPCLSVAKM